MSFEGREGQIIAEQRDQLMQLRKQLSDLKAQVVAPATAAPSMTMGELRALCDVFRSRTKGTTIGLAIPSHVRDRLLDLKKPLIAHSYRQVVETCLMLGLQRIEEVRNAASSVEGVQEVQRPADQGNGAVRAAAS